jgi:hypothetical protein
MEFFYVSFRKKVSIFNFILFWKKTKIFMETLLYRQEASEK